MLATLALVVLAQSATPGVDCSLLTPTQAQGLPCATAPRAPEPAADFVPSAETCRGVNPYVEPEKAVACAAWHREQRPGGLPTFTVGATYVSPYPSIRMVVLAVSLSLDGVPVVTSQFTAGPETGQVFAFRTDQGVPWLPLER